MNCKSCAYLCIVCIGLADWSETARGNLSTRTLLWAIIKRDAVPTLKTILCPYCLTLVLFFISLSWNFSIFFSSFQLHKVAKLLFYFFFFFIFFSSLDIIIIRTYNNTTDVDGLSLCCCCS